jgi:hypothetical protein
VSPMPTAEPTQRAHLTRRLRLTFEQSDRLDLVRASGSSIERNCL